MEKVIYLQVSKSFPVSWFFPDNFSYQGFVSLLSPVNFERVLFLCACVKRLEFWQSFLHRFPQKFVFENLLMFFFVEDDLNFLRVCWYEKPFIAFCYRAHKANMLKSGQCIVRIWFVSFGFFVNCVCSRFPGFKKGKIDL